MVFTFESIGIWATCFFGFDKKLETSESKPHFTPSDFNALMKDRAALASDWQKVGNDMRKAIDEYAKTH